MFMCLRLSFYFVSLIIIIIWARPIGSHIKDNIRGTDNEHLNVILLQKLYSYGVPKQLTNANKHMLSIETEKVSEKIEKYCDVKRSEKYGGIFYDSNDY